MAHGNDDDPTPPLTHANSHGPYTPNRNITILYAGGPKTRLTRYRGTNRIEYERTNRNNSTFNFAAVLEYTCECGPDARVRWYRSKHRVLKWKTGVPGSTLKHPKDEDFEKQFVEDDPRSGSANMLLTPEVRFDNEEFLRGGRGPYDSGRLPTTGRSAVCFRAIADSATGTQNTISWALTAKVTWDFPSPLVKRQSALIGVSWPTNQKDPNRKESAANHYGRANYIIPTPAETERIWGAF